MTGPLDQVRLGAAHEAVREASRRRLMSLRRPRRVTLADLVLVFENRDTLARALEESLRTEGVLDPGAAAPEVAAFSALLPGEDELCACLYVDIADRAVLAGRLADVRGIERHLFLEIAGTRAPAVPLEEEGMAMAPAVSAVRFRLGPGQRRALEGGAAMVVGVEHPSCRARVALAPEQRAALLEDLRDGVTAAT